MSQRRGKGNTYKSKKVEAPWRIRNAEEAAKVVVL
jgi:hypothetical protein